MKLKGAPSNLHNEAKMTLQSRLPEWEPESEAEAFMPPERDKVRALLIDDDPVDASLISRLTAKSRQLDISLTTCRSVSEATSVLARQQFDVLYVDYWMGSQTSIHFIHALNQTQKTPCVLLTGLDEPDIRRIAFRAGVKAFLSKDELSTQAIEGVTLAVLNLPRIQISTRSTQSSASR
jgi:CheY-like chemotaxis protein